MTTATDIQALKRTGALPARDAGMGNVKKFFESQKGVLAAVLPKHVSADRMLKIALGALRTTPKLMLCTIESLMGAVVQCSQLGLEPNTPLGHAYLIPFENKKKGAIEVQIIFGYKGLIELARRSGQIVSIAAHAVYSNDFFSFQYGLEEELKHKPWMQGVTFENNSGAQIRDRGEIIGFYAVAKLVGGGHAFEVMGRDQVERIRNESQNYKFAKDKSDTVWGKNFEEMGRKTVLRRLFKYLPVSIELATANALEGKQGNGESQSLDAVLTGDYTVVDDEAPQVGDQATETDEQLPQDQAAATQTATPSKYAPGLDEVLGFVRSGDIDTARDLARGLNEHDTSIVEQAINNAQSQSGGRGRTRSSISAE